MFKKTFSTDEDETSLESGKKSIPVTEENEASLLLDKVLATPAVRRLALENNVRFHCFYMKENCNIIIFL
jgi:hypothetical protein